MPGTFEFAENNFTLSDCIVAVYNKTANTYGTVDSLASGQTVDVDYDTDNDQQRGYGVVTGVLSVVVGAKLKIAAGGLDFSCLAIMAGVSNYTSNLTPNQRRRTRGPAGGGGLPYFGLIGVGPTDDGGLAAIGFQCCKLNQYPKFTLNGKDNKFNVSEMEGYAIPVNISNASYLPTIRTYETSSLWTAPNDAASFLAFFTA